jgi:hypothetical protein
VGPNRLVGSVFLTEKWTISIRSPWAHTVGGAIERRSASEERHTHFVNNTTSSIHAINAEDGKLTLQDYAPRVRIYLREARELEFKGI